MCSALNYKTYLIICHFHFSDRSYDTGIRDPIGHIDVYFDGGQVQKKCSTLQLKESGTCSHVRAYQFYVDYLKHKIIGYICLWGIALLEKGSCSKNEIKKRVLSHLTPNDT